MIEKILLKLNVKNICCIFCGKIYEESMKLKEQRENYTFTRYTFRCCKLNAIGIYDHSSHSDWQWINVNSNADIMWHFEEKTTEVNTYDDDQYSIDPHVDMYKGHIIYSKILKTINFK